MVSASKPNTDNTQSMTVIDLLRHGECEGGQIFRGTTDSLLSKTGWQQMQTAIESLPRFSAEHIVCSPLQRCADFAQSLSEQKQITHAIDHSFAEISFGDWEGKLTDEVYRQSPKAVEAFWSDPVAHPPPNGERMDAFQQRVINGWDNLVTTSKGQHTLLITHGGVIRIILANLLQMPMRPLSYLSVPYACMSRICIYHSHGHPDWPQLSWHRPPADFF